MRISGRVVHGSKVGGRLGYRTANIPVGEAVSLPDGVYAAIVRLDGRCYGAMANMGVKPTFSESGERVLELHLLGFEGDLYGRELEVELREFVRPERKFPSPEALRTQIEKDRSEIKKMLPPSLAIE